MRSFMQASLSRKALSSRLPTVALLRSVSLPNPRHMASNRPTNWKELAPTLGPSTSLTFGGQPKLPKLVVPELDNTISRLKESLKPLARSSEEYVGTEKKIDAFAAGKAKELQKRLLVHNENSKHWLEQWWDDGGYLGYRDSVVVNVSYYYGFDKQPSHLPQTPAARAAGISRAALIFRQKLREGSVLPEATKEGPICMDTYRWMFDCCRIPGPQGLDWSVSYAKDGKAGDDRHIVVFRKNRFWKIDAVKDGRIMSTEELTKHFEHIYHHTTSEHPGIGVLTASNRDVWAKDYIELSSNSQNRELIKLIHSSAFTVSLEESSPDDPVSFSRGLWHGHLSSNDTVPAGLRNRWVDKPLQFIVYDNVQAGIMGEHSIMDGTSTARLCNDMLDWLHDPSFDHGSAPSSLTKSVPESFEWHISPDTSSAIEKADSAALELINSQTLGYHLTSYGKAAIKAFGVSPDSWAQMIVQLAYARLLRKAGKLREGGTYEAATTRRFYKGRTEAIRVVTSESDKWVQSMDDENASRAVRKELFGKATKKHVGLAVVAGQGQGVDRHLFGLKKVLKEGEPVPELYSDPLMMRSSNWVLSTSAIFSKHFPVYGWGEVVPEGFGVAYMTGYDDRLQYTVTSRKEMPNAEFVEEIAKAAVELYGLHAEEQAARAKL